MKLGNITVQPIVEMVYPYCLPEDALPQATPEAMAPHRHWLEPWFLCPETGQFIMAIQSWLVRTEHHTAALRRRHELRDGEEFQKRERDFR